MTIQLRIVIYTGISWLIQAVCFCLLKGEHAAQKGQELLRSTLLQDSPVLLKSVPLGLLIELVVLVILETVYVLWLNEKAEAQRPVSAASIRKEL